MEYDVPDYGRYLIIAWSIFTGAASLVGNITVLVASLIYNAIKLDKVSVVLIQNLAIADLGYTITIILPTIGSALAQKWFYGRHLCVFTAYTQWEFACMNVVLISALNICKLTCLLYPLRARNRSKRSGYIIAVALWIFSISYTTVMGLVDGGYDTISFDTKIYALFRCAMNFELTMIVRIYAMGTLFTNMSIIIATTAWLLYFVQKVRGLQKQGVVSLMLISVVFILTYMPYGISTVIQNAHITKMGVAYRKYYIYSVFIIFVNSCANPIIYYISVKSFKEFINKIIFGKLPNQYQIMAAQKHDKVQTNCTKTTTAPELVKQPHDSLTIPLTDSSTNSLPI